LRSYELVLSNQALKAYQKLNPAQQQRVRRALETIKAHPLDGKLLHGSLKGYRSYRVGDYRIVYHIKRNTIIVNGLKPRDKAYG